MTVQEDGNETECRREGAKQQEMKHETERDRKILEQTHYRRQREREREGETERTRKTGKQRERENKKKKKRERM